MPVTLERDCLRPLLRKDKGEYVYYVTLKVDGERYLLFINNNSFIYFVSRSLNFYYLSSLSSELKANVSDCLFDGEMVFDQEGNPEFLIFDALFYKGVSLIEMDYRSRMNNIPNIPGLNVTVKKWFNLGEVLKFNNCYSQILLRTNQLRKNKLISDGLILQPFDTNYVTGGPWIKSNNILFKYTLYYKLKFFSKIPDD